MKKFLATILSLSLLVTAQADSTVVFNEVSATTYGGIHWVELHNQMAVDVDISNWNLDGYRLPAGTIAKGRGFLVVAMSTNRLAELTGAGLTNVVVLTQLTEYYNNGVIRLWNNSGRVMDEFDSALVNRWPVGISSPTGLVAKTFIWAKRGRDLATGVGANWTFGADAMGTPGRDNFAAAGLVQGDSLVTAEQTWRYWPSNTPPAAGWQVYGNEENDWMGGPGLLYHGTNQVTVPRAIPGLYPTGVDNNRQVLAAGAADPHYTLTVSANGGAPVAATVTVNNAAWLANDASSMWIGPVSSGSANVAAGNYYYQTTFSLAGYDHQNTVLSLMVSVDDSVTQVLLNGTATPITASGYAGWSGPFTLNSGFLAGNNTLEFRTSNGGVNPTGFRALLSGTAPASMNNTPLATGRTTYYFRTPFVVNSSPALTLLKLRPILDDGAVFYVNGVEVLRLNLPEGTLTDSTPALTNVANPTWSGPYTVIPANLVSGTNWLAVELHQAADGLADALFGLEMSAEPFDPPPVTLAINEIAGATNETFWIELFNYGTNAIPLEGCELNFQWAIPAFVFSNRPALPPGGFLVLTHTELGITTNGLDRFRYLENMDLTLWSPGAQRVYDTAVVRKSLRGRHPDGAGEMLWPAGETPGASNQFVFHNDIVINEIMYHPPLIFGANNAPEESNSSWLELYNRGSNTVDLSGWTLDGGVNFYFPPGTTLAAGGYLVVANDAARMRADYPSVNNILGDLVGRLSGKGEPIILRDASQNPADVVHYRDGGYWAEYADGGGSSLELRDPWADNANPAAWAESDETGRGEWQTYTYTGVAGFPGGTQPTQWPDFVFGLLAAGECLVDDLSVIESPGTAPVEMLANGNFENGLTGWRVVGNHGRSRVIPEPGNPGNRVLHLMATGPQEHMHNHVEATYTGGRTVVNGRTYQISFRARWLAGNNLLNTRLYFNRVARSSVLSRPALTGTPGAPNSRREPNIGPTFSGFGHSPVVPQPSEPVNVTVTAQDPQGVTGCNLFWSVNGGAWTSAAMSRSGDKFTAQIPGRSTGDIVQFYVQGTDGQAATATWPPAGPDSGALFAVADGQADFNRGHNIRIILTPANRDLLHAFTNVMSNEELPGTVVYDEYRAHYDVGVRLKGSERGRFSDTRVSYHLAFQPGDEFRGVHPLMLVDRSGQGDTTSNKQLEILIKHMLNHAGNIPGIYSDLCKVIAPLTRHTSSAILSPRHEDLFIETAFNNGGDGDMYELELIYYPTTANANGYKNPNPDSVIAVDIQNLGDDKELYRYNFMKKNHRDADDYSQFMRFAQALSLSGPAFDQQTQLLMDVDEWMRAWAFVTLCGVGDSYTFGNDHNLLMYRRPSDDRFLAFPVDMDFSFSRAANSALIGNRNISRVINEIPANKRRFYAHVKQIISTTYNPAYMNRWITYYNSFVPEQNYASISSYLQTRIDTANTEINNAGGNTAFAVNGNSTVLVGSNLVTITGTAPVEAAEIRVNGLAYPITWTSVSAWSVKIPVSAATNDVGILAYDLNGQPLTNYTRSIQVVYTNAIPNPVGIVGFSEIMYNPVVPRAEYVELYNSSSNYTFDLTYWRVNGIGYTFPVGSYLLPRSYLVLARNRIAYQSAYGASAPIFDAFDGNLQSDGETLTLFKPTPGSWLETVVDQVRYEPNPPWPGRANGQGAALQTLDFLQPHERVANWTDGAAWQYRVFTVTNLITQNFTNLQLRTSSAGEIYVDDLRIEEGFTAGAGTNLVNNGDFELPLEGTWNKGLYVQQSEISTAIKRSGNSSLRLVATNRASITATALAQPLVLKTQLVYTVSLWFLPSDTITNLEVYVTSLYVRGSMDSWANRHALSPGSGYLGATRLPDLPPVWLNEAQAENLTGPADNFAEREPWLELFNSGTSPLDLTGWHLANNYTNLAQWPFPDGTLLAPGQHLVVWADGQPEQTAGTNLHASFRLDPGAGSVVLAMPLLGGLIPLDYLNYTNLPGDASYGDYPDGQPFYRETMITASPGQSNTLARPRVPVVINEWMADNINALFDPADGLNEDWFELYNPGTNAVDLTGYYLNDRVTPYGFRIPEGYVIPPNGYLLVWADNSPFQNRDDRPDLHVNFALDRLGETIALFDPTGLVVDTVTFGRQTADVSQGRYPNGSTTLRTLTYPTPRAANAPAVVTPNTPPSIVVGTHPRLLLGQSLAFQIAATDAETPAAGLVFALIGDIPSGAAITPAGWFTWTPQAPDTNVVTVTVSDNDTPPLSATNFFIVRVGEPPRFTPGNLQLVNGQLHLSAAALDGLSYRIEFKDELDAAPWQTLQTITPTGGVIEFMQSLTNRQRFYRVIQVPAP